MLGVGTSGPDHTVITRFTGPLLDPELSVLASATTGNGHIAKIYLVVKFLRVCVTPVSSKGGQIRNAN